MRLNEYEKSARREIEQWHSGGSSMLAQAVNWAMWPVDWVVERVAPAEVIDQAGEALEGFLNMLNDASEWSFDAASIVKEAREAGLKVEKIEDLRRAPMEEVDKLARGRFNENTILAAVEGGGTGLGGAFLIAADIPLLFGINLRLIQQIGACYGYSLRGPAYRPLVLAIFNVASSGSSEAKHQALREISVAAAAFVNDLPYKGRISGSFRDQNRHLPREIAKNIAGRKLAQTIPVAGAAVGAGINYWFTSETAESTYMIMRSLHLEFKERL
jgi:uncharacterized protein (DUF697 family)